MELNRPEVAFTDFDYALRLAPNDPVALADRGAGAGENGQARCGHRGLPSSIAGGSLSRKRPE
jgi:hypothetical protein